MTRIARFPVLLLLLGTLLAGCTVPPAAEQNGYAPLLDSPIRGLSAEEVEAIRSGAGMRMALPAELNGHPGPKHILELEAHLGLSEDQRMRVQALYDRTMEDARREGEELLLRWQVLDAGFRDSSWDEATLRMAVDSLDQQHGAVRFVHLRAHLEARDILTPHQRVLYDEARGYGAGHAHQDHAGGAGH